MSYPKQLTRVGEATLAPFQKRIESLSDGETLILRFESESERQTFRHYLYAWLSLANLKPLYRVRQAEGIKLRVERCAVPKPEMVEESSMGRRFFENYCVACETFAAAQDKITDATGRGVLGAREGEEALALSRRFFRACGSACESESGGGGEEFPPLEI